MQRCHRTAAAFEQRHHPVEKPGLATFAGFRGERVQARGTASTDFGIAATKGVDRHFEARFLVKDDRAPTCPLGLRRKERDSRRLATAGFAQDQRVTVGRLRVWIARLVETEAVQ